MSLVLLVWIAATAVSVACWAGLVVAIVTVVS